MKAAPDHALKTAEALDRMLEENPGMAGYFGGEDKLRETVDFIGEQTIAFQQKGGNFLSLGGSGAEALKNYHDTHVEAYHDGGRPSLFGLAVHQGEQLKLDTESREFKALLLVSARAEKKPGEPEPEYHSKNHYVDVAAMTAALIEKNDRLLAGGKGGVPMSQKDKTLLLLSAIAHDIDHGGVGNPPGDHYKNERESFNTILPILKDMGLDQRDIDRVETMLLTTSPNGPHSVLKDVAAAFRNGGDPHAVFDKPADPKNPDGPTVGGKFPELRVLAEDRQLTQMAAVLSDADLSGSFGMGMVANFDNSVRLTNEVNAAMKAQGAKPMDFTADNAFLFASGHIVGGEFASDAGREVMNRNLEQMTGMRRMSKADEEATLVQQQEIANSMQKMHEARIAAEAKAQKPEGAAPLSSRFIPADPEERAVVSSRAPAEPEAAAPSSRRVPDLSGVARSRIFGGPDSAKPAAPASAAPVSDKPRPSVPPPASSKRGPSSAAP